MERSSCCRDRLIPLAGMVTGLLFWTGVCQAQVTVLPQVVVPAPVTSYYYAPAATYTAPAVNYVPTTSYYYAPAVTQTYSATVPATTYPATSSLYYAPVAAPVAQTYSYYTPAVVPAATVQTYPYTVSRGLFGRTIVRTPNYTLKY